MGFSFPGPCSPYWISKVTFKPSCDITRALQSAQISSAERPIALLEDHDVPNTVVT